MTDQTIVPIDFDPGDRDKPRVLGRATERARLALDMLADAELVPVDYWARRSSRWLTFWVWELGVKPPKIWETCGGNHVLGPEGLPPRAVAVHVWGDDGSHATAIACCDFCLRAGGASQGFLG